MEAGLLLEELKDPDLVAQALWAGVHGVASLHVAMGEDGFLELKPAKRTGQLVVVAQLAGMTRRTD